MAECSPPTLGPCRCLPTAHMPRLRRGWQDRAAQRRSDSANLPPPSSPTCNYQSFDTYRTFRPRIEGLVHSRERLTQHRQTIEHLLSGSDSSSKAPHDERSRPPTGRRARSEALALASAPGAPLGCRTPPRSRYTARGTADRPRPSAPRRSSPARTRPAESSPGRSPAAPGAPGR